MRKLLFLFLFFVFACEAPTIPSVVKPDNLIPEDKIVQVIVDVYLLEATLNLRSPKPYHQQSRSPINLRKDSLNLSLSEVLINQEPLPYYNILKRQGVSRKQYESSMRWYCANPKKMSSIYDQLIIEFTKRQTKLRVGK